MLLNVSLHVLVIFATVRNQNSNFLKFIILLEENNDTIFEFNEIN